MNFIKSSWFLSILSLIIVVVINTIFISSGIHSIPLMIEPPQEKVFEVTSVFWTFRTREIESLVQNLRDKNIVLKKKEDEISILKRNLDNQQEEIKAMKASVEKSCNQLSAKILEIKDSEKKNLKSLASAYAAMPAEAAVKVFGHMDDVLIVKLLSFMSAEVVGGIVQAMTTVSGIDGVSPDRVARLSELIRLRLMAK